MISVVIPTLDEESALPATLAALRDQEDAPPFEVILADGGSRDTTVALFESVPAVGASADDVAGAEAGPGGLHRRVVLCAARGRAAQMNAGAALARGDALLFLHADTLLPPRGLAAIDAALRDPRVAGGGFRMRYLEPDARLRIVAAWATLRSRLTGIHYGDQGMFLRRDLFRRLGGFPPLPLFEDLRLARLLRKEGTVITLSYAVRTSGRRLLRDGVARTSLQFGWLKLRHALGADPARLWREYRDVR
ncbi:MAG TPA: TIGR04283 family arsenosugar biosynthesis glycosyltransferase [Candidatus Polarisedimenticolia bacterium]|nr:TIGR04283 family arsenosugar biosynthesis glycosyltransferase [Candidatus Polarisedimenticolia bacterium]